MIRRREFLTLLGGAAVASTLPMLPAPTSHKIVFPDYGTRWRVYMMHNRYSDSQLERLLVWSDGEHYDFTVSDERDHLLAARHRWRCLGKLRWIVGSNGCYEHHIVPI